VYFSILLFFPKRGGGGGGACPPKPFSLHGACDKEAAEVGN